MQQTQQLGFNLTPPGKCTDLPLLPVLPSACLSQHTVRIKVRRVVWHRCILWASLCCCLLTSYFCLVNNSKASRQVFEKISSAQVALALILCKRSVLERPWLISNKQILRLCFSNVVTSWLHLILCLSAYSMLGFVIRGMEKDAKTLAPEKEN